MAKSMPRKFITKILLCFVACLLALGSAFPTMAYAEDGEPGKTKGFFAPVFDAYLEDIFGDHTFNDKFYNNILLITQEDNPTGTGAVWDGLVSSNTIKTLYDIVFSIGASITIAYFLVYLMKESAEGRWNTDTLIRAFIMLIAALWLMANSYDLLKKFLELGASLGNNLRISAGLSSGSSTAYDAVITEINENNGPLDRVGYVLELFLPWVGIKALSVYITIIGYMRMIELFVRYTFAPLAVGDIYGGGPNPTAIRYLRGFLACALQGAVIVVAVKGCQALMAVSTTNITGFAQGVQAAWTLLAYLAAAGGIIGKSNTLAKELCGVG